MTEKSEPNTLLGLTAQIVAAHLTNNTVPVNGISDLINEVYHALTNVGAAPEPEARPEPAVPIKKSVYPDYLICLEDGKKLKMLKRHLMTAYGMTAEEYRSRWDLPDNYPMVAPNYAQKRSSLAKAIGLGRKPAAAAAPVAAPKAEPAPPARRGRKPRE